MKTKSRSFRVQVAPLTNIIGEIEVKKGNLIQTFSRDSGEYEADRSVYPLVLMPYVNLVDTDGVMTNGAQAITGVEWFIGPPETGTKIIAGMSGYEISASGEVANSLKITKNINVNSPLEIYARYAFTDARVNMSVPVVRSVILRTTYFENSNFSLKIDKASIININPFYCTKSGGQWPVPINAQMYSGSDALADSNVKYFWYVKDGSSYRQLVATDNFIISGFGTKNMTFDAAKVNILDLMVRSAFYGNGESVPTAPSNDQLKVNTTIMVRLPDKVEARTIIEKGVYIKPGVNTAIQERFEIYDNQGVIVNPANYYNITWYCKLSSDGAVPTIIGYGERISTTSGTLGMTALISGEIWAEAEAKVGTTWALEGSVFNGATLVTPAYQFGSNQIANRLSAYVIKRNADDTITVLGKLKKNNWNRYEDGSLAPTTVNDSASDLGYDIVYGWNETLHTIENATVGSEQISLFAESPFTYKDLSSREIKPTGICPSLPTLKDGKFRCMYFKFAATSGKKGQSDIINLVRADRSYPVTDLNQQTTNTNAMAKNVNVANTIPFAPIMDWNLLNITNALFNKFGTVDLHALNMFGGGVSSNEAVNASTWLTVTGIRHKIGGAGTWTYDNLGATPNICYNTTQSKTNWNTWISLEYPRMRTLEIQMALSYAAENNIAPDTNFSFDGETYWYKDVPGTTTLLQGEMNAKLFKQYNLSFNAYDTAGVSTPVVAELVLQSSAVYGIDLVSADVFQYAGAGIERVANIADATAGNNTNNICDIYLCTDQQYIDVTTPTSKASGDKYAFETNAHYEKIGTTNQVSSYYVKPYRGTRLGSVSGGSLHVNAMFNELANYSSGTVGQKIRMGHRVRGYGTWGYCSSRSLLASAPSSTAARYFAGGFQVRLTGSVS